MRITDLFWLCSIFNFTLYIYSGLNLPFLLPKTHNTAVQHPHWQISTHADDVAPSFTFSTAVACALYNRNASIKNKKKEKKNIIIKVMFPKKQSIGTSCCCDSYGN